MLGTPQEAARQILETMRRTYDAPLEIVPASAADFGHLDLSAYADFGAWVEAQSFRHVADLEFRVLSQESRTFFARSMTRAFSSADGTISADYYQIKPRIWRVARKLTTGLLNLRWIDSPAWAFKTLRTRQCVGFGSEFDDGSFIVTSNAETAGLISSPPSVDSLFFPFRTAPLTLLNAHKSRVASKLANFPGCRAIVVEDPAGLLQQYRRLIEEKRSYRAKLGWISKAEIDSMTNSPELAGAVYAELKKLRSEAE